jgi:hypothetical protein
VALQIEGIVDGGVHAEETLGRSSRLEALLLALSSSHGLMRILRPIILPEPLLMRTGQSETAERRGVGAQFVGDQQFRREAVLPEQLAHQPQRRPAVAPALDKQVEDLALKCIIRAGNNSCLRLMASLLAEAAAASVIG